DTVVVNPLGSSLSRSVQAHTTSSAAGPREAAIDRLCLMESRPRSEGHADAEVPHARMRVSADADPAEARIATHAVDVRVESAVVGGRHQVLAGEKQPCRPGARDQPRGQLVAER